MIIYKVPLRSDGDEHSGYDWTYSKREANKTFKEGGADPQRGDKIQEIELAFNKSDLLRFLKAHCGYPDNG